MPCENCKEHAACEGVLRGEFVVGRAADESPVVGVHHVVIEPVDRAHVGEGIVVPAGQQRHRARDHTLHRGLLRVFVIRVFRVFLRRKLLTVRDQMQLLRVYCVYRKKIPILWVFQRRFLREDSHSVFIYQPQLCAVGNFSRFEAAIDVYKCLCIRAEQGKRAAGEREPLEPIQGALRHRHMVALLRIGAVPVQRLVCLAVLR